MNIELGHMYRDKVSGFEGVATAIDNYEFSMARVVLESRELHKGKPIGGKGFDIVQLTKLPGGAVVEAIKPDKLTVQFGQKVRCKYTGFEGRVSCVALWLNGCRRMGVCPPLDKDGKIQDNQFMDEHQLDVIEEPKVTTKKAKTHTGGPGMEIKDSFRMR